MQHFSGCDTFLSYNRDDENDVKALAGYLKQAGLNIWLDQWNLLPGDPWQTELEKALERCITCLICWGPSGLGPWQHEEMRAALERQVRDQRYRVMPVLLPACRDPKDIPSFLRSIAWVDLRQGVNNPQELNRLVDAIRASKH
jgi:hypothetical protein